MALQWVENTSATPKFIGGKLCLKGEGNWVDDGPLTQPKRTAQQQYEADIAAGLGKTLSPANALAVSKRLPGFQPTIAIIGDSITNNNYFNSGSNPQLQSYHCAGYWNWAASLLGQRLLLVNAGGVGGNQTPDVLARLQRDMLSYSPTFGLVMIGINDLYAGTSAATIIANLTSIYSQMRDQGITVIACTITPGTFSAAQIRQWTAVNAWIVDYCRVTTGMICADTAAAYLSSTDGAPATGATGDGIHPSIIGALAIGRCLYELLDSIIPKVPVLSASSLPLGASTKSIILNGLCFGNNPSGTNGWTAQAGITGNGPNSWNASRSGTTTANSSVVARSDWRAGQWLRLAITYAANNERVAVYPNDTIFKSWSSGGGVSLNDIVRPGTPKGSAYRVITAGSLATGSDPTAGWSTTLGATFTSGSATLQVVDGLDAGTLLYAQCKVQLGNFTGPVHPTLEVWQYTASYASIVRKSIALNWDAVSAFATPPAGVYTLRTPTFSLDPTCAILHMEVRLYGTAGVTGNFDVTDLELRTDAYPSTFSPLA